MKCSLGVFNFLEEMSSHSHLFFLPFLCIDRWRRLSYLFLLFFGTLHSDAYIFPFLLCFSPLLFTTICKAFPDSHFAFLHFFSMGMVLITVSCTMWQTSVHSSSGILSDIIPWIYLPLPLHNHKGFDLGHTWMSMVIREWFSLLSSI